MIRKITQDEFANEMTGRGFSRRGAEALFEWLEDEESGYADKEFEPDIIACDFAEYESFEAVQANYQDLYILKDLHEHTTVIEIPDSNRLIVLNF